MDDGFLDHVRFVGGVFVGVMATFLIAHLGGGMAESQCKKQASVEECVLMWVPQ